MLTLPKGLKQKRNHEGHEEHEDRKERQIRTSAFLSGQEPRRYWQLGGVRRECRRRRHECEVNGLTRSVTPNDLEQTRDHNEVNETGTIGTNWADPVHDAAGNMTSMPKPSDLGNSISAKYDAWNRLVEVSDGGVLVAKFRYDGEGHRILKMFDSQSPGAPDGLDTYEHLFLKGQQVIETRKGSGSTAAQAEALQPKYQHIWSPRYIDSLILRDANTDGDGLCDDSRVYYLADANFNVTALIDTSGNVLERYLYSPYGEVTVLDSDFSADADGISDYANVALYTGRTLDVATGLMYYRARYYHSELGRFVGRDSASYLDGASLYRYVSNMPLIMLDPSGDLCMQFQLPEYKGNGLASWPSTFELGENEKNGFIIQKVTTKFEIRPCEGEGFLGSAPCGEWVTMDEEGHGELVYWEIWTVIDGEGRTAFSSGNSPFPATVSTALTDRFAPSASTAQMAGAGTRGVYRQKGEAVFIRGNPLNQSEVPRANWKIDPSGPAHSLWYSCTAPEGWKAASRTGAGSTVLERWWAFAWNLCCKPPIEPLHGSMQPVPSDDNPLETRANWGASGRCEAS
jgi:RHS repeat-associated protein